MSRRSERVPDRWLPVAYFTFAHCCLLAAFLTLALAPRSVVGFFYHPRMLAVVHLVTLGWITSSILGALHMILPMAMRTPLPARHLDRWAFWFFSIGVLGMVSHFWIDESGGMVWSAGLVVAALVRVGWRTVRALRKAPVPFEHRLPFFLAFANILLAGALGMLIGIDKGYEVLPGFVIDHVVAHAHLAALGWATFMVMGASYRLLPMMLPAAVPKGRDLLLGTVAAELGVLGLTVALWFGTRWAVLPGLVFLVGVAFFLSKLRWMTDHRRPAPKGLVKPDYGVLQVVLAFSYLVAAMAVGVVILSGRFEALQLHLITAYGALGLLGFLSQMVAGVSVRLLPLYVWMREFSGSEFSELPPSPHDIVSRPLQRAVFWLWTLGLPTLILGLVLEQVPAVASGGALLTAATVASLFQMRYQLRPHELVPYEQRSG